jgi:single-strand DNA-binding protein
MASLNSVTLVGRVGGDPDVKYFESGTVKARITLAVDRRNKKDDEPDWFNLELWGKTAEVAANYIRKGKQIAIKGSFKFDRWTDKQTGSLQSRPVIHVDELELLGNKNDTNAAPASDED